MPKAHASHPSSIRCQTRAALPSGSRLAASNAFPRLPASRRHRRSRIESSALLLEEQQRDLDRFHRSVLSSFVVASAPPEARNERTTALQCSRRPSGRSYSDPAPSLQRFNHSPDLASTGNHPGSCSDSRVSDDLQELSRVARGCYSPDHRSTCPPPGRPQSPRAKSA